MKLMLVNRRLFHGYQFCIRDSISDIEKRPVSGEVALGDGTSRPAAVTLLF